MQTHEFSSACDASRYQWSLHFDTGLAALARDQRSNYGTWYHTFSGGISIQRRSFQLLSPASASCTPLAPSTSVHLNGVPS